MAVQEFFVRGTPVSHQAHNRRNLRGWENKVARDVFDQIPAGQLPATSRIHLRVVYVQDYPIARIDVDNLVKPIQDALQDILYEDDASISFLAVK